MQYKTQATYTQMIIKIEINNNQPISSPGRHKIWIIILNYKLIIYVQKMAIRLINQKNRSEIKLKDYVYISVSNIQRIYTIQI